MKQFISRFIEKRLDSLFTTTLTENMAYSAAAAFACGLSAMDGGLLHSLYPAAFAVMLLAWIFASLAAGFLRQWLFILYSTAFWFLPLLFAGRPEAEGTNALNAALARLAGLIVSAAPTAAQSVTDGGTFAKILAAGTAALFLAGFAGRRRARRWRLYCEARLKHIQGRSE